MSMYLPNPVVRPSESDAVEFIDLPTMAREGDGGTSAPVEAHERPMAQLSPQARIDVTQRALDYIMELVASYGGGSEDVRLVIHDLHEQIAFSRSERSFGHDRHTR
jgi:hypothetical protein